MVILLVRDVLAMEMEMDLNNLLHQLSVLLGLLKMLLVMAVKLNVVTEKCLTLMELTIKLKMNL